MTRKKQAPGKRLWIDQKYSKPFLLSVYSFQLYYTSLGINSSMIAASLKDGKQSQYMEGIPVISCSYIMLEAGIHMCSKKKLFWKFQEFSGKWTDKMKYKLILRVTVSIEI